MTTETHTRQQDTKEEEGAIRQLFSVGAHYAYKRSRRHPSAQPYIFGAKNRVEIFDLEKTEEALQKAEAFLEHLGSEGKTPVFVGGKNEAQEAIREHATRVKAPYVAGRWIGGTVTNFEQIRGRIQKLEDLEQKREKGELAKYTKKERLLIDREIEDLKNTFGGLRTLTALPDAFVIVDVKREQIALDEALNKNIPVVTLSGSDCDLSRAKYPIPGNDSSHASISYVLSRLADAYERGVARHAPAPQEEVSA